MRAALLALALAATAAQAHGLHATQSLQHRAFTTAGPRASVRLALANSPRVTTPAGVRLGQLAAPPKAPSLRQQHVHALAHCNPFAAHAVCY